MEHRMRTEDILEQRPDQIILRLRSSRRMASGDRRLFRNGQHPNKQQNVQEGNHRPKGSPPNMGPLPQRQLARDEKLVRRNGGFSWYSNEKTTRPDRIIRSSSTGCEPDTCHKTSAQLHFLRVSYRATNAPSKRPSEGYTKNRFSVYMRWLRC